MPNAYFHFKQFSVYQARSAMKVGTDGVLLGAWVNPGTAEYILDIGTGTGLVALMLAQRSGAVIHAVEIDAEAAEQAGENFLNSPWKERLTVYHRAFQDFDFRNRKYDLMVANPPYFNRALRAPDTKRSLARHDNDLDLNDLMAGVVAGLGREGRFGIVYPASDIVRLSELAFAAGLHLIRQTHVIPAPGKQAKRVLMEFSREEAKLHMDSLIIEDRGRHQYSESFRALIEDFYLKP